MDPNDIMMRRKSTNMNRHLYEKKEVIVEKDKKKDAQIWQNFDKLLNWFADFMHIEHKPRLVIKDNDVTNDAHAQNTTRVLIPNNSMSPLYFKYGVPENCVIRLC
jgi:hypothetical protein